MIQRGKKKMGQSRSVFITIRPEGTIQCNVAYTEQVVTETEGRERANMKHNLHKNEQE